MPRVTPRVEVVKPPSNNSMVASAVQMTGTSRRVWQNREQWQTEAWRMYDTIGELRYAANWVGNVLSRTVLHVVKFNPKSRTWEVVYDGAGAAALAELFGGKDGQAQMLKTIGIHFFVAGECYLVGRHPRPDRGEKGKDFLWEIVSTEELKQGGKTWQVDYQDGLDPVYLAEDEIVIRLWMSHPRKKMMADSPVKAQIANLRELELLTRRVSGQVTSQIAGNGVVFIPAEMSFPPDPERPNQTAAEAFMNQLGNAMLDAIADPTSPASVVPTVAAVPGEYVDKINHVTFWSEFDEQLPALRKEAIGRLAVGLDIPAEVMLGTADMNHWSAWQVEESAIKVNVEPTAEAICNCLTTGYLWDVTEDTEEKIGYDTSQLRLRPNRSKEAIELWDRGELSSDAMRRETGFDESDAPSQEEYIRWLLNKIAGGSATPEMVAQAAEMLGAVGIAPVGDNMRQERPAPSLDEHPIRELPQREAASMSLRDKSEVMVLRAMERAGNRLKSLKQMRPNCYAHEVYLFVECQPGDLDKVMEDAWSVIPIVFRELPDFERTVVMQALDTYCRHLLLTKTRFDRSEMERYLTTVPVRSLAS